MGMSIITNRKATFDYAIEQKFEAGVALLGFEVKAVRAGKANLTGSYVVVRAGEAYLVNASITPYQEKNAPETYDPLRTRRLLLTKKELHKLAEAEDTKGLALIPLAWYNKGRRLKLELAIGKGKRQTDKREGIKKRESDRSIARTLKGSE